MDCLRRNKFTIVVTGFFAIVIGGFGFAEFGSASVKRIFSILAGIVGALAVIAIIIKRALKQSPKFRHFWDQSSECCQNVLTTVRSFFKASNDNEQSADFAVPEENTSRPVPSAPSQEQQSFITSQVTPTAQEVEQQSVITFQVVPTAPEVAATDYSDPPPAYEDLNLPPSYDTVAATHTS